MRSGYDRHDAQEVTPADYRYSLGLTSQFYFCALPLRLDAEPRCAYACLYCFSKARGGADLGSSEQVADAARLRRRFERVHAGTLAGPIDAMLAQGAAIHFGGMSDPFSRRARARHATDELLGVLADYGHATVISTKGLVGPSDSVLADLSRGRFLVQFSFSTIDDRLAARIEVGCPLPSQRLVAMKLLAEAGIPVSARIQPLLPEDHSKAHELLDAVVEAGARHVGVEHLKVPLERQWPGTKRLSEEVGIDLVSIYRAHHAQRVGRELVLRPEDRLPSILQLRGHAHRVGISFGAADTDLLLLSDGDCCCSGADLLGATQVFNRHTYPHAVHQSPPSRITISALRSAWAPSGSIAQWVNSKSRIASEDGNGAPLAAYVRRNWNGRANGAGPNSLWGVVDSGEVDDNAFRVYELSDEARALMRERWTALPQDPLPSSCGRRG